MIVTTKDAEIPLPEALSPNGERNWTYAELDPPAQLLLLSIETTLEADYVIDRTLLFSSYIFLSSALANLSAESKVIAVQFISPGSLNGTGHFRLDLVRQIWRDQLSFAVRYVLADGSELIDGDTTTADWQCVIAL